MRYALLFAFAFLLAGGQILFKKAALASGDGPLFPGLLNGWTFVALALYGVATLIWIAILRSTPLSVAYPFAALGFIIVPLASRYLFGEMLDARYLIGAACITLGIVLTSH